MKYSELKYLWYSDLYRYIGNVNINKFIYNILFNAGYKYTFFMRLSNYLAQRNVTYMPFYLLSRLFLLHYSYKFGISISFRTNIGSGFYIGHFGTIVVNPNTIIGKNFNISQGVTIAQANRGKNKGCPTIGDNVYIGPGAKIIGKVHIGNNVAVGANCVVTKDVPDNAVVVGVPGKVISYNGSKDYVTKTNY
jgi:serine O-acetyltransferase